MGRTPRRISKLFVCLCFCFCFVFVLCVGVGVGGVCVIEILQHKVDFPVLGVSFIMRRTPQTISKLFSDNFFRLLCTRNIMA